jgi:hypothetical protein
MFDKKARIKKSRETVPFKKNVKKNLDTTLDAARIFQQNVGKYE